MSPSQFTSSIAASTWSAEHAARSDVRDLELGISALAPPVSRARVMSTHCFLAETKSGVNPFEVCSACQACSSVKQDLHNLCTTLIQCNVQRSRAPDVGHIDVTPRSSKRTVTKVRDAAERPSVLEPLGLDSRATVDQELGNTSVAVVRGTASERHVDLLTRVSAQQQLHRLNAAAQSHRVKCSTLLFILMVHRRTFIQQQLRHCCASARRRYTQSRVIEQLLTRTRFRGS